MTTAASRDPRSIITPDALVVSDALIGKPLASPRRRAAALMIDGLVIVVITAVTSNFGLILGVILAVLFVRAGFKRTPVKGSVFGRAMRFSVGCLGVFIALITGVLWVTFGFDMERDPSDVLQNIDVPVETGAAAIAPLAANGLLPTVDLGDTRDDAVRTASELIETLDELGLEHGELRGVLIASVDADASWVESWPATVDSLLSNPDEVVQSPDEATEAAAAEIDALSTQELLREYTAVLERRVGAGGAEEGGAGAGETGGDPTSAGARETLLRARLADVIAGDSLRSLERRVERLTDDVDDAERDLSRTEQELQAARSRSIGSRVLDLADDLGFGFGWAGLYLTVFLSWWNGQTVGKRLMGIRVVRLDGGPITWWIAFERAGGYAAGLFTGLLGFAQVWWDANRQAIHDRIVGTAVVYDKAEKVLDWEEAL